MALLLVTGLLWGIGATLAFWHQAVQADEAAEAYRNALADLSRQQIRIADINRGLTDQRANLGRLLRESTEARGEGEAPQPLHALEGEIAGLLTQVADLQGALTGIHGTLESTLQERQAIMREREAMAERVRDVERRGQERARDLERQLAAAHETHEEVLGTLARRTRASVAEVERILGEAGLEPTRMLPPPAPATPERPRRGNRGGPFVAASAVATPATATAAPAMPVAYQRLHEHARGVHHEIDWLERLARLVASTPIAVPLAPGYQVESGFGRRSDPIRGSRAHHTGIDLSDDHATPVYATAPGRVTVAGWEGGYGRVVEIDHGFGLRTRYAHLSGITVEVDQQVSRFTRVGRMGSTGRSTGTHLHYEVMLNGHHLDPARFMQGSFVPTANTRSGQGR